MSWTYDGLPGEDTAEHRRDAVRLLVRDTTETAPLLEDEEIAFFLAQASDNIYRAAARACLALANTTASAISVGDLSVSGSEEGANYPALAETYNRLADRRVSPFVGGISVAGKESQEGDTDRVVPAFTRGLHTNPWAGRDEVLST